MSVPQFDIGEDPASEARLMIFRTPDPRAAGPVVLRRLAEVPAIVDRARAIDPAARLNCVIGFGGELWNAVSPSRRPAGLRSFEAIRAADREAPATGGDLMLHIFSTRADLNFRLALDAATLLGSAAEVVDDIRSMRYLDSRDLTGFIDGTENPKGAERLEAGLIGNEDPEFAGGSYVFTQRYVHDFAKWASLANTDQEKIVGRTKPDSVELSGDSKPPTAHISRVVIEEGGEELQIVRYSFPYGTVRQAGLMFIAYTRDLAIPHKMLARMIGTSGDGLHDRLLEFTRAVSGANFFIPSRDLLERLIASTTS